MEFAGQSSIDRAAPNVHLNRFRSRSAPVAPAPVVRSRSTPRPAAQRGDAGGTSASPRTRYRRRRRRALSLVAAMDVAPEGFAPRTPARRRRLSCADRRGALQNLDDAVFTAKKFTNPLQLAGDLRKRAAGLRPKILRTCRTAAPDGPAPLQRSGLPRNRCRRSSPGAGISASSATAGVDGSVFVNDSAAPQPVHWLDRRDEALGFRPRREAPPLAPVRPVRGR